MGRIHAAATAKHHLYPAHKSPFTWSASSVIICRQTTQSAFLRPPLECHRQSHPRLLYRPFRPWGAFYTPIGLMGSGGCNLIFFTSSDQSISRFFHSSSLRLLPGAAMVKTPSYLKEGLTFLLLVSSCITSHHLQKAYTFR